MSNKKKDEKDEPNFMEDEDFKPPNEDPSPRKGQSTSPDEKDQESNGNGSDEGVDGNNNIVKSDSMRTAVTSPSDIFVKKNDKRTGATVITFCPLASRPEVARVLVVLCNISDRPLHFSLKCAMGSNVSAFPSGSGAIDPRGQSRLTLSWHRPPENTTWAEAVNPKMLLVFRFQDRMGQSLTPSTTRLMGKINANVFCKSTRPPEEQLLLDAEKDDSMADTANDSKTVAGANANAPNPSELLFFFACLYLLVFLLNSLTNSSNHHRGYYDDRYEKGHHHMRRYSD